MEDANVLPDVLPMKPYCREQIWGGRRLLTDYGKDIPAGVAIGEAWEISAYSDMESIVASGPLAGSGLGQIVRDQGGDLLGRHVHERYGAEFPLLIKLIDAQEDLSVQVHPDDDYVRDNGLGSFGKDEAWYVLASETGRTACGLKEGVDRGAFETAVADKKVEDVIRYYDVSPGDVVHIPPGTVHALCSGVMIYEVQQSSDLTFRVWDYDRPGPDGSPRDLRTDRAIQVIDFQNSERRPRPWQDLAGASDAAALLVDCPHYRLQRFSAREGLREHHYSSFAAVTVIDGRAEASGEAGQDACGVAAGGSFLVPADRPFRVSASQDSSTVYLVASIP